MGIDLDPEKFSKASLINKSHRWRGLIQGKEYYKKYKNW